MGSSARAQRAKRVVHVPEVQIDGSVEYYDYEHDKEDLEDHHAIGVGVGTLISFYPTASTIAGEQTPCGTSPLPA